MAAEIDTGPALAAFLDLAALVGDGVLLLDRDGRYLYANAAAATILGSAPDELRGRDFTAALHGPERNAIAASLSVEGPASALRWSSIRPGAEGATRIVEYAVLPRVLDGQPVVVVTLRDVTERRGTRTEGVESYERLQRRMAERTHELSTLLDVSHNVASTLELQPLLGLILDQLAAVVEYSGAAIHTVEGDTFTVMEYRGPLARGRVVGLRVPLAPGGPEYRVIHDRTPVILDEVRGQTALIRAYGALWPVEPERDTGYIRSWLGLPLLLKDRLIGMMVMAYREPAHYTGHHAQLAMAIANQAAIAIENARLFGQAQEVAVLEERQRLARELHDSVSQALYGIALGARTARTLLDRDATRAAEPLDYVLALAEAGLAEMRALILELRPEALKTDGLVAALEKQTAAIQVRHGIAVEVTLGSEPEAPLAAKEALYRIAQEAMHNTIKHAHARRVEVRLMGTAGEVTLEVRDDGTGFNPNSPFPGHLGLQTMRERAMRLGGTIGITSSPGSGTVVRASIPCREDGKEG